MVLRQDGICVGLNLTRLSGASISWSSRADYKWRGRDLAQMCKPVLGSVQPRPTYLALSIFGRLISSTPPGLTELALWWKAWRHISLHINMYRIDALPTGAT